MTLSEVREYLAEAKKAGATWVWFFGGEPFLYFDLLASGIEYARQLGLRASTTSNAFWATSEELAVKRLSLLKERGLHWISFSAGPFHCEYVPLEHIRNAISAAQALDILGGVCNCYFVEREGNAVVRRSREISARLSEYEMNLQAVNFTGTAAEVLAQHAPKQPWTNYGECRKLADSRHLIIIDPYGCVQPGACSGICIGNAREKKLSEIIKTYGPQGHPILKVVDEEGPAGLARMAMSHGFKPTEYADECHLCYEARKVLLNHYPEHLGPAIWYERAK